MANVAQPLDQNQQDLINIVKLTHTQLAVARKTKVREVERRYQELKIQVERQLDEAHARISAEVDREIASHERAQDESLVAAYNAGIPVKRIAEDGFGNRYPGGVQQLLNKLRLEGRIGNSEGYQRNTTEQLDTDTTVNFPAPVDVSAILSEATTIAGPHFERTDDVVLIEPDETGEGGVSVEGVKLTMDVRDPYFKRIEKNARPGTTNLRATTATIYQHPFTGLLVCVESSEDGDVIWDHPVARWVKDHPAEARDGFDAALGQ